MKRNVIEFPTYNVNLGDAILVVKHHLTDEEIAAETKMISIQKVAEMETHNSVTKDDLVNALRYIFNTYEF